MRANSPVDKSREFIASGMTLITDPASDRYLSKVRSEIQEAKKKNQENRHT